MTSLSLERVVACARRVPRGRPLLIGELAVVGLLVFVYDRVRELSQLRPASAIANGQWVLDAERFLHVDLELKANLWLAGHRMLGELSSLYYQTAHLTVTLLVLAWCYWRRPDAYRSARNTLVAINVVGFMVFWVFPVAPPRLAGAGFIDTAMAVGVSAPTDPSASMNPYAAMPSLHLAWAAWVAVVGLLLTRHLLARLLCLVYPTVTAVVVMATANHYLLDVVAGVVVALVMARLTGLTMGTMGTREIKGITGTAMPVRWIPLPRRTAQSRESG